MAEHSSIEWTDATWNPITGCSIVSPGCTNCYAMKLAGGRLQHHPSRAGLTKDSRSGPVWTGEVRLNEDWLDQPLRWRRPRQIFVCAHGDLFAEAVPDEWIDRVFAVMALAPHHTFQVLTKRAERMREYVRGAVDSGRWLLWQHPTFGGDIFDPAYARWEVMFRNVWLGVSAEDQERADQRIPALLETPAAVRFVSAEPLLGPIDLTRWLHDSDCYMLHKVDGEMIDCTCRDLPEADREVSLDWIIVGGESGPGARPMHPDWARSLRDQCQAAGVAFHFKQWGAWSMDGSGLPPEEKIVWREPDKDPVRMHLAGKKAAGRLLDGRTWDEVPA